MDNLIKNKRTTLAIVAIVTLISLSAILYLVISNISGFSGDDTSGGLSYNNVYQLPVNPTDLQKGLYKDLTSELNNDTVDHMKLSELVVRSFIADYFTWTNKVGTYDVGGLPYICGEGYLTFDYQSRTGFYEPLSAYISKYGAQNLIEVDSIDVTMYYANPFDMYGDGTDMYEEAYYAEATWTYKENAELDTSEFLNHAYFTIIEYSGVFQIAEILY